MVPAVGAEHGLALAAIALLAGVGVSAIGPGGIFLTIALFSLTPLSPGQVAGTASATMVGAGLAGSLFYYYSGELKQRSSRHIAVVISVAGMVGSLAGTWLNAFVSSTQFGALLGVLAMGAGCMILIQEWRGFGARRRLDVNTRAGRAVLVPLGFGIGTLSGLLGVGGPVLAVPALILLGVPILDGIAIAQVQSVFIAASATASYAAQGTVPWLLAASVGVPLLVGVLLGWRLARRIEPRRLKMLLAAVLIVLGPYLALRP